MVRADDSKQTNILDEKYTAPIRIHQSEAVWDYINTDFHFSHKQNQLIAAMNQLHDSKWRENEYNLSSQLRTLQRLISDQ